jgi:hypothetical protein
MATTPAKSLHLTTSAENAEQAKKRIPKNNPVFITKTSFTTKRYFTSEFL